MACSASATKSHIREVDMEDIAKRFQRAMNKVIDEPTIDDIRRYEHVIDAILKKEQDFTKYSDLNSLLKANKAVVKRSFLFQVFLALKNEKGCTSADERYIRNVLQIPRHESRLLVLNKIIRLIIDICIYLWLS